MKISTALLTFLFSLSALTYGQEDTANPTEQSFTEEQAKYYAQVEALWNSVNRHTGTIDLLDGAVKLDVPETFYYITAKDAEKVLADIWGNPPGQKTLGMLFPKHLTPLDANAWGVTIEYEEDGYVSDEDASEINYSDLLTNMKQDTEEANTYRVEQGYESIELVGWAAPPFYDESQHKLHWAQELQFSSQQINTLNYNIRILGRKGVLLLNFVAGIDQLGEINTQLDSVLSMAEFNEGSRYADFDPSIDKVAAYGLGALVAGKVLAKTGIIAVVLIFLKKFGIYIIIALGALIAKIFKREKSA